MKALKGSYVSLFLITACVLFACEKDANIDLGEFEKEVVVTSFLSPSNDTTIVQITYSRPLFGDQKEDMPFEVVLAANVEISNTKGHSVTLPFDHDLMAYAVDSATLPVERGETYFLKVTTPNDEVISSVCTVPLEVNKSIQVIGIDSLKNGEAYEFHFDASWADIVNTKNYYRIHAYVNRTLVDEDGFLFYDSERIIFKDEYDVFDDVLFENISFTIRDGNYYNAYFEDDNATILSKRAIFHLLNVDEHYFKYHNSINTNINVGLFSEPSLIYSNIEGGLGCFGAFTTYKIEMAF